MEKDRFTELYEEHWSYVYSICRSRLGDEDEALDAAMEVFLRKWRALETYDPKRAKFKTWLARNAEHLCVDLLRRRGRRGASVPVTELDALPHAEKSPLLDAVSDCLLSLDPADRQLLLMHEVDGYTWEEIAAETALTVSQARTRVARVIEQVRDMLEPTG